MNHTNGPGIPLEEQRRSWDAWNAAARETKLPEGSRRQAEFVVSEIERLGRRDLSIIDVGCGTGWMCEQLTRFGRVTGTDLAKEVLERAQARLPMVRFVSGDALGLDLPKECYDVAVTLEVLSHVADQPAFVGRLAQLLKPDGLLVLATQNRPVHERWSAVDAPDPTRIRRWVNIRELRALLAPHFIEQRIDSLIPVGDRGYLRVVNSAKLDRLLRLALPAQAIKRAKERAFLGRTLVVAARKRATAQC